MVSTFGAGKNASSSSASSLSHQERINVEMFKAIEMLGKKLERTEGERERLQRRIALIESAATVDEKTGRLYLPVVVDPDTAPQLVRQGAPRWAAAASLMSSVIALLALGVVLFREPAPTLTPQQLAALSSLSAPKFAKFENRTWTRIRQEQEGGGEDSAGAEDAGRALTNISGEEKEIAKRDRKDDWGAPDDDMLALEESNAAEPELARMEETGTEEIQPEEIAAHTPVDAASAHIPGEDAGIGKDEIKEEPQVAAAKPAVKEPPAPRTEPVAAKAEPVEPEPAKVAAAKPAPATPTVPVPVPAAASVPAPAVSVAASATQDVERDPALPEKLAQLEKRAFDNIPEAQHDLATLYASGKLVGQDYKRAAYWFSKAADGGVANAHYNLGVMFQQGLGVAQDMKKAIGWYEKAAELGHPEAMYNLGIAFIEGVGTERNIDRGVSFFRRAASAGVAQAGYNLGVLYESNFVGAIDMQKALEWYQVAADQDHADAQAAINRLRNQLADGGDHALTLADMVEPSAGEEGMGQGDASFPGDEVPAVDDLVMKIQTGLIRQGYLPGKPSGHLDQQTEDAIRAFQKNAGLRADGIPSKGLLEKVQEISGKN